MSSKCRRPLHNRVLAEDFVDNILSLDSGRDSAVTSIIENETTLAELESHPTICFEDYRVGNYRANKDRKVLHDKILGELITFERIQNDDEIALGSGGARPAVVRQDAQAYIVSGPPASGKSSIATRLADETGAYILDSDYAKRKFPEFESDGGASLVHEESDCIVFSSETNLFEYCVYNRNNMVIPLVGKSVESFEKIICKLLDSGYELHILNICLDRYECVRRAFQRFTKTKRYVPLSYIFDEVGNEPERVYFLIKRKYSNQPHFLSFSQISTDVKKDMPNIVLEASDKSPIIGWEDLDWTRRLK